MRWRLHRPKQKAVVQTPKNYAEHASRHYSIHIWLLGWSSCSSPSTKELHDLGNVKFVLGSYDFTEVCRAWRNDHDTSAYLLYLGSKNLSYDKVEWFDPWSYYCNKVCLARYLGCKNLLLLGSWVRRSPPTPALHDFKVVKLLYRTFNIELSTVLKRQK